ncbi:MAG: hypothetical protein D6690_08765 [Nitrospirae bacterium]|nr:MAG: hypothetical protein D6690_08765 [Nitrospirota bacterium]
MSTTNETRIRALMYLLSDPDERIAQIVHDQLVQIGSSALSYLQCMGQQRPELALRLNAVKEAICFRQLLQEFQDICHSPSQPLDLEAGAFLIARTAYPDLDPQPYIHMLDDMAEDLRARHVGESSIEESLLTINRYLFDEQGFVGNREDYYDPDNSFLHRVIDRRKGIPISLSVLYLLVGVRLRLPLAGVSLPGHFMLTVKDHQPAIFIDCFNNGQFLTEEDCALFLNEAGIAFRPRFLRHSSHDQILARMLRNLIGIYQSRHERSCVRRFQALMTIIDPT